MPIPLPPGMQDDYLLSKSVMDPPRSPVQKLVDFFWGRTPAEQATSAFTGGVGKVVPENPLSKLAWNLSKRFMQPEVVQALERSPLETRLLVSGQHAKPYGTQGWYVERGAPLSAVHPYMPGQAYVDTNELSGFRDMLRATAHEMTHAAQDIAGRPKGSFPGLMANPSLVRREWFEFDPSSADYAANYASRYLDELLPTHQANEIPGFYRKPPVVVGDVPSYRSALDQWFGPIIRENTPEPWSASTLTRPWVGVYKGPVSQGRTVPKSYVAPKTFELNQPSPGEQLDLLRQLGVRRRGE